MYKIKHIIISFNQKEAIKYKKHNILAIENYLSIYKKKYRIQLVAYGLNSEFLHLVIRDERDLVKEYIKTIIETLDYYYNREFKTEINMIRWKIYDLFSNKEIIDTIRYLHKMAFNSNKKYLNYSKYVQDELIDTHLLMSSKNRMDEFLSEPSDSYVIKMKKIETNNTNNKMLKRRNRAEDFFNDYLISKGITKTDLISNDSYKEELVDKFRNETDLSFRDIGYVLGISHTSVIRIWNKCIDNKLL